MSNQQELLFDTNCLIDIYHGRIRIRDTFESILTGELLPYLSVISEAELWRGLRAAELRRHEALVSRFTILPLHSEAARLAGQWMKQYQAVGLGWMDALIAASGTVREIPILTRDKRLAQVLGNETSFVLYGHGS